MDGQSNLDGLNTMLTMLDFAIDTEKKKHIAGGILLSISMLFGGLAFTVMTTKLIKEIKDE
jgi:hypothetical protein